MCSQDADGPYEDNLYEEIAKIYKDSITDYNTCKHPEDELLVDLYWLIEDALRQFKE